MSDIVRNQNGTYVRKIETLELDQWTLYLADMDRTTAEFSPDVKQNYYGCQLAWTQSDSR